MHLGFGLLKGTHQLEKPRKPMQPPPTPARVFHVQPLGVLPAAPFLLPPERGERDSTIWGSRVISLLAVCKHHLTS